MVKGVAWLPGDLTGGSCECAFSWIVSFLLLLFVTLAEATYVPLCIAICCVKPFSCFPSSIFILKNNSNCLILTLELCCYLAVSEAIAHKQLRQIKPDPWSWSCEQLSSSPVRALESTLGFTCPQQCLWKLEWGWGGSRGLPNLTWGRKSSGTTRYMGRPRTSGGICSPGSILHLTGIKVSWLHFQEGSKKKNCEELNNTTNRFNYTTRKNLVLFGLAFPVILWL